MPDNRGRYVRVGSDAAQSGPPSPPPATGFIGQVKDFFSQQHHHARQKRRILSITGVAILIVAAIVILHETLQLPRASNPPRQVDLKDLAGPIKGQSVSFADGILTYVVGEHHAVDGKYPDDYIWIDPYSRKAFNNVTYTNGMNNNAMGRMPAGSPYEMLVVARGRNDEYMDPQEKISYNNLTIVGFFANYNPKSGQWERAGPEPYVLEIPVWRQHPRPCRNLVNGGGADPRFLWSDAGEPLAVIGTSSTVSDVCKTVGIVDLRAVWPGLKEHLEEIGFDHIPVRFDSFTELGRNAEKLKYEKNWAPFFSGPMPTKAAQQGKEDEEEDSPKRTGPPAMAYPYFATQIFPRTVVKINPSLDTSSRSNHTYALGDDMDLRLNRTAGFRSAVADSRCLFEHLPSDWRKENLHQATPFYRMTLCNRGACTPDRTNTILLGLVHYKLARRSYRRMFVTMSVDEPFEILSVSPLLHFGSAEIDEEVVFSVSMTFMPTKKSKGLAADESPFLASQDPPGYLLGHGWLDDTLVVGAGLRDEAYDAIHLPVILALRGHALCARPELSASS